jgi:hypothetical protein
METLKKLNSDVFKIHTEWQAICYQNAECHCPDESKWDTHTPEALPLVERK